jgi:hypothetical protein
MREIEGINLFPFALFVESLQAIVFFRSQPRRKCSLVISFQIFTMTRKRSKYCKISNLLRNYYLCRCFYKVV